MTSVNMVCLHGGSFQPSSFLLRSAAHGAREKLPRQRNNMRSFIKGITDATKNAVTTFEKTADAVAKDADNGEQTWRDFEKACTDAGNGSTVAARDEVKKHVTPNARMVAKSILVKVTAAIYLVRYVRLANSDDANQTAFLNSFSLTINAK